MAERDTAWLEAQLVDLGLHLDLPEPPHLSTAVRERLAEIPPARPRRARRRTARIAVAAAAALIGLAALTPPGQAAVNRIVHAFGVALHLGTIDAPTRPEHLPGETPSALDLARHQVHFPIIVPQPLGSPDTVTVSDNGRVLSLIYRAVPGRPAPGPGGVSARLDEFDGTPDVVFLKQLSAGAEWVQLPDGSSAVWIGAPHSVTYIDRNGTLHTETAHLSAHTLIWSVAGVTLRLEGAYTREAAIAIAAGTVASPGR